MDALISVIMVLSLEVVSRRRNLLTGALEVTLGPCCKLVVLARN